MHRLDQLLLQLSETMARHASDPTLFDDRQDRPGSDTAGQVAGRLELARPVLAELARHIDQARELSSHLGNERD